MVTWRLINETSELRKWDSQLLQFNDHSIYQTLAWGEQRRMAGWHPYRWAAFDGATLTAMAQGLLKRYPGGIGVVWLPGGPVGDISTWNSGLQKIIRQSTHLNILYCRFNSFRALNMPEQAQLLATGWCRPRSPLGTGASLLYDVERPESERIAACSKNWRHNLKRAQKGAFTVNLWQKPDTQEMRAVYSEMEQLKQLPPQHTEAGLRALYTHASEHLTTYACRDKEGRLLGFRACAIFGDKAFDLLAATALAGRKSYASYATFWALTQECHRRGIRQDDLSGVDAEGNRGVYDFKQGTGATPVSYLGEWEWASPSLFAIAANWMIGRRRHGF